MSTQEENPTLFQKLIDLRGRRRLVLRSIITVNVIYTILLLVILFHNGLTLLYTIEQKFSLSLLHTMPSLRVFWSSIFISIAIMGHVCGLFGVLNKSRCLLLLSAFIGLAAGLTYGWLLFSSVKSIPIMVFVVCLALTHIQLNLVFTSLIVSQNFYYKSRSQQKICKSAKV